MYIIAEPADIDYPYYDTSLYYAYTAAVHLNDIRLSHSNTSGEKTSSST